MNLQILSYLFLIFIFISCIGDDFVDDAVEPELRITTLVDTIRQGDSFQFEVMYLNNVGQQENVEVSWNSSNNSVLTIDQNGLANAVKTGNVIVTASYESDNSIIEDQIEVVVGMETVINNITRSGTIQVTSNYILKGNFTLSENNDGLLLEIDESYEASENLPGLYIYLTNNPSTTAGAFEIGAVTVFEGTHSYDIPNSVQLNQYSHVLYFCKPFNVKIGDGEFIN
ncbi:MAG: hypothetical protein HKO66_12530 [Saprospiraceae bacterium]|nr:Ig-like domain-containing protein [Bacteroidia bacterium]NNE15702.1 hypothetical protein [Saprospiraceae bacterium]NNL93056.1 hypothetical protein [Saprospiraceae bacterium]